MSKMTNPITEASVSCGFYNSLGDRKYDATQLSSIFSGIIRDGIFASIGDCLVVRADSGNIVNVGVGKAWFNDTWTQNDSVLAIDCGIADSLYARYDAIVIEVNSSPIVRDNFIKVIHGIPSSSPVKPALVNTEYIHQYALCYIYRPADLNGVSSILDADIENMVGSKETPFVTGILEIIDLDTLLGKWRGELDRFVAYEKNDVDAFISTIETDFQTWWDSTKRLMGGVATELEAWIAEMSEIVIPEDTAATIVSVLAEVSKDEIERFLVTGLNDGVTTVSDDDTVITTVDSSGRTLTKTFTDNFTTVTTVLSGATGGELGRLTKRFSADGRVISSTMNVPYNLDSTAST